MHSIQIAEDNGAKIKLYQQLGKLKEQVSVSGLSFVGTHHDFCWWAVAKCCFLLFWKARECEQTLLFLRNRVGSRKAIKKEEKRMSKLQEKMNTVAATPMNKKGRERGASVCMYACALLQMCLHACVCVGACAVDEHAK